MSWKRIVLVLCFAVVAFGAGAYLNARLNWTYVTDVGDIKVTTINYDGKSFYVFVGHNYMGSMMAVVEKK